MTPKEAAKALGALGGAKSKGRRLTEAHRLAIANSQRARWARRSADAARVAALAGGAR